MCPTCLCRLFAKRWVEDEKFGTRIAVKRTIAILAFMIMQSIDGDEEEKKETRSEETFILRYSNCSSSFFFSSCLYFKVVYATNTPFSCPLLFYQQLMDQVQQTEEEKRGTDESSTVSWEPVYFWCQRNKTSESSFPSWLIWWRLFFQKANQNHIKES